jgi:lysyl-tRNA synthetase class 2
VCVCVASVCVCEIERLCLHLCHTHTHTHSEDMLARVERAVVAYEDEHERTSRTGGAPDSLHAAVHTTPSSSSSCSSSPSPSSSSALVFQEPFDRVEVMPELCARLGVPSLPDPNASDPGTVAAYRALCDDQGITVNAPHTVAHYLDKLIGALIEPHLLRPTFLLHHPVCMSPLAKALDGQPGLSERFELYVNGMELVNAYSELNRPNVQEENFRTQQEQHMARGEEQGEGEKGTHTDAHTDTLAPAAADYAVDAEYVTALEYGLPPTAGWGLGTCG